MVGVQEAVAAIGDGKAVGENLECLEARWQEETEDSLNEGPSQMAGNHYFIRQTILLLRKNVSLMINYVFWNIIKIQCLFFLDFQDQHFDTHYHKHLIYAGERIIALGILGVSEKYPSNTRRRMLKFCLTVRPLNKADTTEGAREENRKSSAFSAKCLAGRDHKL